MKIDDGYTQVYRTRLTSSVIYNDKIPKAMAFGIFYLELDLELLILGDVIVVNCGFLEFATGPF